MTNYNVNPNAPPPPITVHLDALIAGSKVTIAGSNEMIFIGRNSSTTITQKPGTTGDHFEIQATNGRYRGSVEIKGYAARDSIGLDGFTNSRADTLALSNALRDTHTSGASVIIPLPGGGHVTLDTPSHAAATAIANSEYAASQSLYRSLLAVPPLVDGVLLR